MYYILSHPDNSGDHKEKTMPQKFSELLKEHAVRATRDSGGVDLHEMENNLEVLRNMMKTDGSYRGPRIPVEEAVRAADFSILFPKVISDVLIRPKEPLMIGQTLLSRTIQIDNVRSIEFPAMGAMVAYDMADTAEYREQMASFTEELVEIKVNKVGIMVSLSEDLIKDSMWDLIALYIESAGYAMLRHKEEKIFNTFLQVGHKVFDNNTTNPALWTHGRAYNQSYNYSATYDDIIDAMGGLVANEYVPTDIVMHPLAWAVFAKDPVLRNVMFTQGQIGQSVWSSIPAFDQTPNVPWNISYQVSPFVPFQFNTTLSNGPASSLAASNITSIFVIDRNHGMVVLQRDAMQTDQFDDPRRDLLNLKIRERYGVNAINGGRSVAVLNNIRIDQNWAPPGGFLTVTPS
jgi:hypothetical protein